MRGPLNLASRPFRNEHLPSLLTGVLGALLVGLTIAHAVLVYSLSRGGLSRREGELKALAAEEQQLRQEAGTLRVARPGPSTLAEWRVLKDLVDRRNVSWSALFSRFEEILPPGVRISAISPAVERGVTTLDVSAYVTTPEDGLEFLKRLSEAGDFREVYPTLAGEETSDGRPFHYRMRYVPRAAPEKAGP
jgi:hypothetical protein